MFTDKGGVLLLIPLVRSLIVQSVLLPCVPPGFSLPSWLHVPWLAPRVADTLTTGNLTTGNLTTSSLPRTTRSARSLLGNGKAPRPKPHTLRTSPLCQAFYALLHLLTCGTRTTTKTKTASSGTATSTTTTTTTNLPTILSCAAPPTPRSKRDNAAYTPAPQWCKSTTTVTAHHSTITVSRVSTVTSTTTVSTSSMRMNKTIEGSKGRMVEFDVKWRNGEETPADESVGRFDNDHADLYSHCLRHGACNRPLRLCRPLLYLRRLYRIQGLPHPTKLEH